uniref:Uncharacterized protein n=1 Tax=Klebsiella phage FKP3 TaxID=3231233 RepID=A0AAU8HZK3_9CAUD
MRLSSSQMLDSNSGGTAPANRREGVRYRRLA